MARAQTYTPDPIMRGDTWNGFIVGGVAVNGGSPPSPAASATLDFYERRAGGPGSVKLSLPATITNAATWAMNIPAQVLALGAGDWDFRLRVVRADGAKKTYVQGTLTIH
jgi:hypothetical protein